MALAGRTQSNNPRPADGNAPPSPFRILPNLPAHLNTFIGREAVVDEIRTLVLWESVKVLTLTGPGGVGKTRVAIEVARRLLPEFEDGVWFVPLAPVTNPELVVPAIAGALGLKEEGTTPLADTLREHLQDLSLLLVLDNFEQLAEAAPQVSALLAHAPGAQAIVTSRKPLRIYGEYEYQVPPMDVPGSDLQDPKDRSPSKHAIEHATDLYGPASPSQPPALKSIADCDAVQLFVDRAREVDPRFTLTRVNASEIAEICRRLDGLPLALELAATRLRLFTPKALLSRLEKSLPLLTGGARNLPDRQRTLYNSIAWSYNLLDPAEQDLFSILSVFVGGCTLSAIESLASDTGIDLGGGSLLDRLESLVAQSLMQPWRWDEREGEKRQGEEGEPRFWMLSTIREFALEKLVEKGQSERAQMAHARFFQALAERAKPHLRGANQELWFEALARDHDNFRAALTFLLRRPNPMDGARLANALMWFWYVRGYYTEGRKWLDMAVSGLDKEEQQGDEPISKDGLSLRADLFRGAGTIAYMQNDHDQAVLLTRRSLDIARMLGDKAMAARALNNLGTALEQQGDVKQALPLHEESLQIRREIGDRAGIAFVLANLSLGVEREGDYERAAALCEESLSMGRELGDSANLASYTYNRGRIAYHSGNLSRAEEALRESLLSARELGFQACEMWALSELGMVLSDCEDAAEASRFLEEAMALAKQAGDLTETSWILAGQARVALLGQDYERARSLLLEALRIRLKLREFNNSTVDTLEWLANLEAHAAQRHKPGKERARRAVILFGAANARREAVGSVIPRVWRAVHDRALDQARALLGHGAFSAAWSEGRALSLEEAINLGLGKLPSGEHATQATRETHQPPPNPEDESDLTSREVDVLRLVAAGLTNKDIADRLVLSPRTVQAHLYRIFGKLDVTTRSAATRFALDRGLL